MFIAKHIVWLRDQKGHRVEVKPGRRLPDWVSEADAETLLRSGAIEREMISVQPIIKASPELRAAVDSYVAEGSPVVITTADALEAQNASLAAAADALGKEVEYQDGKATVKPDAAPETDPPPTLAKTTKKGK